MPLAKSLKLEAKEPLEVKIATITDNPRPSIVMAKTIVCRRTQKRQPARYGSSETRITQTPMPNCQFLLLRIVLPHSVSVG